MPFGNVFEKINSEYYQLTGAEKRVADYVVAHQQKTQFMSISELAEECGVAEATISRFCRRLHYKGYNAFKLAIANSTAGRVDTLPPESDIKPEDTIESLSQKLYVISRDAMAQTLDLIQPEQIRRAADILSSAEKVLCMGQGGSMLLAQECAHLFSTSLPNYYAVMDSHLQAMACSHLTKRDAVLYYSYSGSTEELLKNLKIVRERKAKVILITRFPKSPGASYAHVVLQCGSREGPLQGGSVPARVTQLFLTDVLFHEVCRRHPDACAEARQVVAESLSDKHI
ncbi:MAG TPA: MurR/RpiR family transcriptional regulator [Clostridiales bacterium]|nr:MurR/RpiR family transcriptional regulator [Clostridiales bacterium]